jgi:hypothetical protein
MFCTNCGKKVKADAKFCNSCGVAIIEDVKNKLSLKDSESISPIKVFNFRKIFGISVIGLFILLTILFGLIGSFEENFFETLFAVIVLSGLISALLTFAIKWSKRGFTYEKISENLSEEETTKLKGLNGWLSVVALGIFVALGYQLYGIYTDMDLFSSGAATNLNNYIDGYSAALGFELILDIIFALGIIYLIYLFFKKNKRFPRYYIIFLIASVIYLLADYGILSSFSISNFEVKQEIDKILSSQVTNLVRAFVSSIIWGLYMTKSKRVKATFIEN